MNYYLQPMSIISILGVAAVLVFAGYLIIKALADDIKSLDNMVEELPNRDPKTGRFTKKPQV